MSKEESIKRWELIKYFCDRCPKHGASTITTYRVLALQNASDIYAMHGLRNEDALNYIKLCGNCEEARLFVDSILKSLKSGSYQQ